jgi:small subunit ribosomal protein S17
VRENRKMLIGRVVSDKMDQTVVVLVTRRFQHPLYRRIITRTDRYKAHDPKNQCHMGDLVRIGESRPISKDKHWKVEEIMEQGHVADVQPSEIAAPTTGA